MSKKYVDCFFPFVDLSCNGYVFTLLSTIGLKLIYVYHYIKKKILSNIYKIKIRVYLIIN